MIVMLPLPITLATRRCFFIEEIPHYPSLASGTGRGNIAKYRPLSFLVLGPVLSFFSEYTYSIQYPRCLWLQGGQEHPVPSKSGVGPIEWAWFVWKKSGKTEQTGHQGGVGILACWRKYTVGAPTIWHRHHLTYPNLAKKRLDDIHYFQKQPWNFTDRPQWLPIFFRTKSSASSKMVCLVVNFMSNLELFCLQVSKNDTMTHLHDC